MATKVKLATTELTAGQYVKDRSISWGPRDLSTRIDVARFALRESTPVIPDDDMYGEITDTDGLTKVFAGIARQPDVEETVSVGEITYQVALQGWGALAYRTPITSTESYAAGVSDAYIVSDLLTKYYGAIGTGLTHRIFTSRPDMPAMVFTGGQLSLGQALDQIATEANGAPWWIDPDKAVHWNDTRRLAPFIISTAPDAVARESYRREVLADKPVAYYRLGETSGTVAKDASGNGRDATIVGQTVLGRAGFVDDGDGAVSFSAPDYGQGIVTPEMASAFVDASVSIEVWINAAAGLAGGVVIDEESTATGWQDSQIEVETDGRVLVRVWGVPSPFVLAGTIAAAGPHQVVLVYDRTNSIIRSYLDGVAGATLAHTRIVPNNSHTENTPPTNISYRIGTASGATSMGNGVGFSGLVDEVSIYKTALSATRIAAHYAARVKRKVGTRHITRLADSTQQAHRVKVVGNSSSATYEATDWTEWARLQKRRADEPGSPAARVLTLPDVADENLTTLDQAKRRAFSILANQARRRPYVATVNKSGLEPGMRVDVISSKYGTGATGQPTIDDALTVRAFPALSSGMGRFTVQRVEPTLIGNDEWAYKVTFGDFQPTLPIVLAKATGRQSVTRTSVASKTLTNAEMANRLRRIPVPIFGATVRTGAPAISIYGANTRYRAWAFDPNVLEEIIVECALPKDAVLTPRIDERFAGKPYGVYLQAIVTLVALGANAGGVEVRVTGSAYAQGIGDLNSTGFETITQETHQIIGPAHNILRRPLFTNGVPVPPQGPADHPDVIVRLVIGRDGGGAFDTLVDDVGLYAVELEYLADS